MNKKLGLAVAGISLTVGGLIITRAEHPKDAYYISLEEFKAVVNIPGLTSGVTTAISSIRKTEQGFYEIEAGICKTTVQIKYEKNSDKPSAENIGTECGP